MPLSLRLALLIPLLVGACGSASNKTGPGAGEADAAPATDGAALGGEGGGGDASAGDAGPGTDAPAGDDSGESGVQNDGAPSPDAGALEDAGSAEDSQAGGSSEAGGKGDASACGILPVGGLYATIASGAQLFHVWIDNQAGIDGALSLWHGTTPLASIPNGPLICQQAGWNCPWHWQIDPKSVAFAEVTIEVCDGTPLYVDSNCTTFGGGRYCPWYTTMTELRDCRTDSTCPTVAK